ncbi:hypothetical protein [Rathayibacter rathayi]|uniref:hypothetical protein n=1 Tax=Rathayibacter rathayi TaxID=33887 RepID=UPI000CE80AD6|nr:hypothetical protein [Rathayibacter rathayi]PPH34146.1 hypothetical protein C5C28_10070 [Rathayibacter rathayi]
MTFTQPSALPALTSAADQIPDAQTWLAHHLVPVWLRVVQLDEAADWLSITTNGVELDGLRALHTEVKALSAAAFNQLTPERIDQCKSPAVAEAAMGPTIPAFVRSIASAYEPAEVGYWLREILGLIIWTHTARTAAALGAA